MSAMGTPMPIVRRAQDLVRAGWTAEEASRILATEGIKVSGRSVRRWTSDKAHRRDLEHVRRAQNRKRARTARFALRSTTPEYREAFVQRLRAEEVPMTSIAKVCTVVFGEPVTRHDVLVILGGA